VHIRIHTMPHAVGPVWDAVVNFFVMMGMTKAISRGDNWVACALFAYASWRRGQNTQAAIGFASALYFGFMLR
jgi:hypothetical protein